MKIKLTCGELPGDLAEDLDLPAVPDTPLKRAFQALANALSTHPDLQDLKLGLNPADYPDIEFPDADATVPVEVILVPNRDAFAALDIATTDAHGIFLTTGTPLEEESYLATGFRALVLCDEEELFAYARGEREQETDSTTDRYDADYVRTYLNTLTHEVAHAVEFISHGHGLTPAQVDIWNDSGELDRDIGDITTGRWIRDDMQDERFLDEGFTNEVTEGRVEEQGYDWLSDCIRTDPAMRAAFNEVRKQLNAVLEAEFPVQDQTASLATPRP